MSTYEGLIWLFNHLMKWHKMLWIGRELNWHGVWLNSSASCQGQLMLMLYILELKLPQVWSEHHSMQCVYGFLLQ